VRRKLRQLLCCLISIGLPAMADTDIDVDIVSARLVRARNRRGERLAQQSTPHLSVCASRRMPRMSAYVSIFQAATA